MMRNPDFKTYFGTAYRQPFKPLAFWVFLTLTPRSCREFVNIYLTDPWARA